MSNPIRKLPMAAAIYATGDILVKATSFLLLPLLTRYLSPRDYGIVGSVTAFAIVLGLILQLNLHGAVMRFYGEQNSDEDRRRFTGTLMAFSLIWSSAMVLVLNVIGPFVLNGIYKEVSFEPYLRMGTWIATFNALGTLPLTVLQVQQRPGLHRLFSISTFLLHTSFMLFFVIGMKMGAYGALMGQLVGAGLAAIGYLVFIRRHAHLVISRDILKMCLVFSLPLLVYALGGWIVDMSNRIFIERFINLDQLGLFNVATQFAMVLGYLLNAVGMAFTPLFYETVRLSDGARVLARFGIVYVAAALGMALTVAVFSREAIVLLTEPRFHAAYRVVPILTATQALTAFWHLIVNPLMLKKKTGLLMTVMLGSAVISILINVMLVPRFGIIGAALAAFAGNLALNCVVFFFSIRAYPVPYDYRQLAIVVGSAVGLYFLASVVAGGGTLSSIAARALIVAMYPVLLIVSRIVDRSEVERLLKVHE